MPLLQVVLIGTFGNLLQSYSTSVIQYNNRFEVFVNLLQGKGEGVVYSNHQIPALIFQSALKGSAVLLFKDLDAAVALTMASKWLNCQDRSWLQSWPLTACTVCN